MMKRQLPTRATQTSLALPAALSTSNNQVLRRSAHRRTPRLEQVRYLDYANGLLAAAGGCVCCVWQTTSREIVRRIVTDSPISALCLARDQSAVVVSEGNSVRVFSLTSGEVKLHYAHDAPVTSVHLDAMGITLASVDESGELFVYSCAEGVQALRMQYEPGKPVVYVSDARTLLLEAATHSDIVDIAKGRIVRRFSYDSREQVPEQGRLMSNFLVTQAGQVLRWFDTARYGPPCFMHDLGSEILSIDIDNRLGWVLAATANGTMHVFDLYTGQMKHRWESFTVPLMYAKFGAQGSIYAAGGEALVMHIVEGKHQGSFIDVTPPLVAMQVEGASASLLLSNRVGGLVRVGLQVGKPVTQFVGHAGSISTIASCATHIASGAYDGKVMLWHPDGSLTAEMDLGEGPVQALTFEPGGTRLWVGTWMGRVSCIDVERREKIVSVAACRRTIRSLSVDPAGTVLFIGSDVGELLCMDLNAPGEFRAKHRQFGAAYRVLAQQGGTVRVTCSEGVRIYNAADWQLLGCFEGGESRWFAQGHGRLYSISLAGELSAFDEVSGALLERTRIEVSCPHRSVGVLSPDRIATASSDGCVRIFDARLKPVAALELMREGFDWSAPGPGEDHPGWIFTSHPDLLVIGEDTENGWTTYDFDDPRRRRHLARWHSPSHVLAAVNAVPGRSALLSSTASALLGEPLFARRLTHKSDSSS